MLLKNKTAVITGSNRGIGKEILSLFSENGADIFACTRNIDKDFKLYAKKLEEKFKNRIILLKLDLSNENQIKETSKNILDYNKPIDILVNNAATIHTSLFQMTSKKKLSEVFDINFFAQTVFTQYILKSVLKQKKGSIIYISSTAAIDGNEGRSAYAASKAALISQVKVLSKELGKNKIRVNAIAPGLTNTDMMTKNTPKNVIDETISKTSLKRLGSPAEIAKVALFLASDMSDYITGQTIRVDGGM
tara:strand:+ start:298 stop:1041 length:744 start_codon:yes stop_codon:yes gene_type:complete